jgi:hypothetical protein
MEEIKIRWVSCFVTACGRQTRHELYLQRPFADMLKSLRAVVYT